MSDIAAVGSPDVITIFRILGADCYPVEDMNGVQEVFRKAYGGKHKVIFVMEDVYVKCRHLVAEDRRYPQVTVLPGIEGSRGSGLERIRKLMIKALGSDITENAKTR